MNWGGISLFGSYQCMAISDRDYLFLPGMAFSSDGRHDHLDGFSRSSCITLVRPILTALRDASLTMFVFQPRKPCGARPKR